MLVSAHGQEVVQVTAKQIQEHTDHRVFPRYPPEAKAAHVQGTVVLSLRIGTNGKIESMDVVSGPPMLRQAATDALKQWTFHPFDKDGVPAIGTGRYNLIFTLGDQSNNESAGGSHSIAAPGSSGPVKTVTVHILSDNAASGPDEKLKKEFASADDACKKGVLSQQFNDATVSACKNAAELAEKLQTDGNYVAKRSAFVYAATAYGDTKAFRDALPWANKAVQVVKLGHDDNSGNSAAYSIRGQVEAFLGDLDAADRDLTAAEDYGRKAIPVQGNRRRNLLAEDLRFHAKVLQALGRAEEASKKLDEAAKYN